MSGGDAGRPGRAYFVPEVRIAALGALQRGAETGRVLTDLQPDVISVEVTRVNTGAGQFSITLNNWFDTLPADRDPSGEPAGTRESLEGSGRRDQQLPKWPRWKFADLAVLTFGQRLRIDMRYWPTDSDGGSDARDASADDTRGWVPMICGPITDMKFTFATGEGARLEVSGEEDFTPLRSKNPNRVTYGNRSDLDIVQDVLRRANFPPPLVNAGQRWPSFATNSSDALHEEHAQGQSYLEYLQKFSERLDLEVFIEFADLTKPDSGIEFHMEPARSRVRPNSAPRDVYVLEREKNLIAFAPTIKIEPQFTKVTVRGRHRDHNRPEAVRREAEPRVLDDELHVDPGHRDPQLESAPQWRERLYGVNEFVEANRTNIDDARATVLAESILRRRAREFMTVQGTTVGLPMLRPGRHVEIRGYRAPFDGFFYVTRTVHSYGENGLRTQFTARRPGMPRPDSESSQ